MCLAASRYAPNYQAAVGPARLAREPEQGLCIRWRLQKVRRAKGRLMIEG
jgi:hypothetical protein